ncbi:MAG: hypothetical protein L0213_12930 [Candidatus Dadabacteria bacterium]|nr:hypothetical protein [Candidatus Dadabacteria bacterium]HSC35945.1 hypothetical protein [Thermodesulfobacteriota bacterium]
MNDIESQLLNLLCKGAGQGNSNTDRLTQAIVDENPGLEFNQTKIRVVEALNDLKDKGQIQIMTINWELGDEFLYICTNIIE